MTNYYSNYISYKKDYNWNRSTCIGENNKYLKSIADSAVTECNEIIIFMDNLSTKKTNTEARNVTSNASLSCHSVKGSDNYYCVLPLCKTKRYTVKWKIMNLKKFVLRIVLAIILMI